MDTITLVAPLGETPGTVTALYHRLEPKPNTLYLLHTSSRRSRQAAEIVETYLKRIDSKLVVHALRLPVSDIETAAHADAFRMGVNTALDQAFAAHAPESHQVIVSVAGGRKSMTALMTITAQMRAVQRIVDLWVHADVERRAADPAQYLNSLLASVQNASLTLDNWEIAQYLKPDDDQASIIDLPVIPLVNIYDAIHATDNAQLLPKPSTGATGAGLHLTIDVAAETIDRMLAAIPGRLTQTQATELQEIETLQRHGGKPVGTERIIDFLVSRVGLRDDSAWTAGFYSYNSQQIADEVFVPDVLAPLEVAFKQSGVQVDLRGIWTSEEKRIKARYDNSGKAGQHVTSLLLAALKVGRPVTEQLTDEDKEKLGTLFLSYSHHDATAIARRFYEMLSEANVSVWWDKDLLLGDVWNIRLQQAMEASFGCVLIVTPKAMESTYILEKELNYFDTANKRILAIMAEGLSKPETLPFAITRHQYANLATQSEVEIVEDIVRSLRHQARKP